MSFTHDVRLQAIVKTSWKCSTLVSSNDGLQFTQPNQDQLRLLKVNQETMLPGFHY